MNRKYIIEQILLGKELASSEILEQLKNSSIKSSKSTLNRDLIDLEKRGLISKSGQAKSIKYKLSQAYQLLIDIDLNQYFEQNHLERKIYKSFQTGIFDLLKENSKYIFDDTEKTNLIDAGKKFQTKFKKISPAVKAKEFERLCIELAWKSSSIEGNTYSLLETETLIKMQMEAKGKQHIDAVMILNHKKALDYILSKPEGFKELSPSKIINLHKILVKDLYIDTGIRKELIGISGTQYRPPGNRHDLEVYMEQICDLINKTENVHLKAIFALVNISYTQMFIDGNKRTSRMLANAILLAHGLCPLSFGSLDETEYKKALMLFYEKNNLANFKNIYLEQMKFAVENYFL